jgi:hypothetical protein
MAIVIDGQLLMVAVIQSELGEAIAVTGITRPEAEDLAKRISLGRGAAAPSSASQSSATPQVTPTTPVQRGEAQPPPPPARPYVTGKVVDQTGAVIPQVLVMLLDATGKQIDAASTGDTGRFQFNPLDGRARGLQFRVPGFESYRCGLAIDNKGSLPAGARRVTVTLSVWTRAEMVETTRCPF